VGKWSKLGREDVKSPGGGVDLDGGPLPSSYPLLKEGIERFFITDINNPAASARAQSELFIMLDAFAARPTNTYDPASGVPTEWAPVQGQMQFNHLPGGCNVLFMDGHVEFVRYKTDPIGCDPNAVPAHYTGLYFGGWSHLLGGQGN